MGHPDAKESWFVCRTQPYRELWAAENVARQNGIYYLPKILESVRIVVRGVRKKEFRTRPLFPCYLFVKAQEGQWRFLLNTFGISAVVMHAEQPGLLPGHVVDRLKAREKDGLVVLPAANKFDSEQPVRLIKGAFSGHVGIVQGNSASERVRVLLDLLGRKTSFLVAESSLEAA